MSCVTVVPLCCFCNVALIFATMKTFILQQVKCCHLSSSKSNCTDIFLAPSLLFLLFAFSSASFLHRLFFPSEIILDLFLFLMVQLCIRAGGDLGWDSWLVGVKQRGLTFPTLLHLSSKPLHHCFGFTVTNEKSPCLSGQRQP